MKQSDLYREYARVIDMCEPHRESGIHPNDCVIHNDHRLSGVPYFNNEPANWKFAIAIVEGKPVFEGDVLYHYLEPKGCRVVSLHEKGLVAFSFESNTNDFVYVKNLSWNPPAPPRKTITINGNEYPAPDNSDSWFGVNINGKFFSYKNSMDAVDVTNALLSLLEDKK